MADETSSPGVLLQSPLHDRHAALGAKFAEFGGWSMPLEYPTGVVKEHTAVRESVGVFDVSHLGKVMVTGPGAAAYVNATLSNDLGKIAPGRAQYTLCCDAETGGIVDDLIAYYHDDEHVLLVPNAANSAEVCRRLIAEAPEGVKVLDHHTQYAVLAVQGTKSDEVLDAIGFPTGHDYMSFVETEFEDTGVVVCRTGYTGERGYELIALNEVAGALWDRLLEAGERFGMLPCGLGARDTLGPRWATPCTGRTSPSTSPRTRPASAGRSAGRRTRSGARTRWSPRRRPARSAGCAACSPSSAASRGPGCSVSLAPDVPLCEITSGTFSPTLRKGIGMALVPTFVDPEAELGVQIRTRREVFTSTKVPLRRHLGPRVVKATR